MREQPDFSTHPRPRRPPAWEVGLVIAGTLALLLAGRSAWLERRGVGVAREQAAEARRQLASIRSRIHGMPERPAAEARLLAGAAAAAASPPDRVVARLAGTLPADVRLDRLTIEYKDAVSLEMVVVARDARSWDLFLARLDEDETFQSVIPGSERREGEVHSQITARWVEESR